MSKDNFELRLNVVLENERGLGYRGLSKKYKLNISTIKNWCRQYQSLGIEAISRGIR